MVNTQQNTSQGKNEYNISQRVRVEGSVPRAYKASRNSYIIFTFFK